MIIACAPLRFSLNGGGSDLPIFSDKFQGEVVSITLDRYVYVTVNKSFSNHYRLAYSRNEYPKTISEIQHPIIRSCLEMMNISDYLEITSIADVPSNGSGLGSSSAFTVALLKALHEYKGFQIDSSALARMACEIEIEFCHEPIGRQDQWASAIGGLNSFSFRNSDVTHKKIFADTATSDFAIRELNQHLSFFHLPNARSASQILKAQSAVMNDTDYGFSLTMQLVRLAKESSFALQQFDYVLLGKLLTEGWQIKSQLNGDAGDPIIVDLLKRLDSPGIYGGKLLGAGSGGFIAVITNPTHKFQINSVFHDLNRVDFEAKDVTTEIVKIGRSEYNHE
jgi:D-glycero-alpha-D-manno-heptose-7-phosphate kinase